MELICQCGNPCLKSASIILNDINGFYSPCKDCKEFKLKKFSPLAKQIDLNLLDKNYRRCVCGKRYLDVVMAHILIIMMEEGIKGEGSNLRDVCVPLITPAYPLDSAPYLKEDSLVILSEDVDMKCAQRILNEIPEVKGVLKGNLKDTIGIKEFESNPTTYDLLAGCDLRCDVINTPWGVLCIYKYQGQIHIELPKPLPPKIEKLKKALNKYNRPKVLDCTCGPGTLGIAALLSGADRVVFNDLWYPACQTTAMNLEINGYPVECTDDRSGLIAFGDNFEVHCLDVKDLKSVLDDEFDICLIDVFPGVDPEEFADSVKEICREVVII